MTLGWLIGQGTAGYILPPIRSALDASGLSWLFYADFADESPPLPFPHVAETVTFPHTAAPGTVYVSTSGAADWGKKSSRLIAPESSESWIWAGPFTRKAGRTFVFRAVAYQSETYSGAFGIAPFISADDNPHILSAGSAYDGSADYDDQIVSWTVYPLTGGWAEPLPEFDGGVWDATAVGDSIACAARAGLDVAVVQHTAGFVVYYRLGRSRDWQLFGSNSSEENLYWYMVLTGGYSRVSVDSLRVIDAPDYVVATGANAPAGMTLNWLRRAVM